MTNLADLIKRDNITAHWVNTHEVSTGPHTEYEVWDLLLVRDSNEPQRWVTDGDTRRTAYIQGIGGSHATSRRETGGNPTPPDLTETLATLLTDAQETDDNPTFREWAEYRHDMSNRSTAWEQLAEYEELTRNRDTLRAWLPDAYDEYLNAERD
jgi:hypothetical protein